MSIKSINPTNTNAWSDLKSHYQKIKDIHLYDMFKSDKSRASSFSINWNDFYVDFSKNKINKKTINLFSNLLEEINFKESIDQYFSGVKINTTESRAVLHTALRAQMSDEIFIDGENIVPTIFDTLEKIKLFSQKVISGSHKGFSGNKITDVVNIGIGGSDLGPSMVIESLSDYKTDLKIHFVSNVDGDHLNKILNKVKPESTLFIIVSKTFKTIETLTNADTVRSWFLNYSDEDQLSKHFIAVTGNKNLAIDFGVDYQNIFPLCDWVGGRFSLWSSVGVSISLAIGYEKFSELLEGAREMDIHFKNNDFAVNIPAMLACITFWYNNFFNYNTHAIIPYSENLKSFTKYLQQASMESNGKQTDRSGKLVNYQTGEVLWGQTGTNAQHSFFQLLHQGTKIVPLDFIGFSNSFCGNQQHHNILMANFFAQTKALMMGTYGAKTETNHKLFKGNRPTNTILINKLTPKNLGSLICLYEHKIFSLGILWNINSYDQFGVELGKKLSKKILEDMKNQNFDNHDSSTRNLLNRYFSTD